jgi:hypothetical protein
MKIKPEKISEKHIGCLCLLKWSTSSTGFIGHSHSHGLQSGSVSTNYVLVGRLCQVTEEKLFFLTAWVSSHSTSLSFGLGPHGSLESYVYEVNRKDLTYRYDAYINPTERANSIQQKLRAEARAQSFWSVWPRVSPYFNQL